MPRFSTHGLLLLATLLCLCASHASAFRFLLPGDSQRCFTEEVPSNTDVKVAYAAGEAYAQFVDVALSNAAGELLWEDKGKTNGHYTYRVMDGTELVICFTSRTVRNMKVTSDAQRTIALTWKVGAANIDYKDLATKEKLKPIEVQLRVLEDAVRNIHTEYVYYKEKEAQMRNTSEHMTAKVMWMAIVLIVIFVAFSYFQMRHLKSYFRKKRMID